MAHMAADDGAGRAESLDPDWTVRLTRPAGRRGGQGITAGDAQSVTCWCRVSVSLA
jgi:hypothetical protein